MRPWKSFFGVTCTLAAVVLLSTTATAVGSPTLLKNLNPGAPGSSPADFTRIGGTHVFSATTASTGRELFKTDGTAAGTKLLKDIGAGAGSESYPEGFTRLGDELLFAAGFFTSAGSELWSTDGTTAGTRLVKDINPRTTFRENHSAPAEFTTIGGGIALFAATTAGLPSSGNRELWRTDGTTAGTRRVKDINPGAEGSLPQCFGKIGDTVFFVADDGTSGFELWKSDGTGAGTRRVKDINPGVGSAFDDFCAVEDRPVRVGQTLFFGADNGVGGEELWKTNGTPGGTTRVKEILSGPDGSNPSYLTAVGTTLYFTADDENINTSDLWKSNGTPTGTQRVGVGITGPDYLTNVGGTLFFVAYDVEDDVGDELWMVDPTGGAAMVQDINPGTEGSNPHFLTRVGTRLFFVADDGTSGYEPWTSTTSGDLEPLGNINPGAADSNANHFTLVGNKVLFAADDGVRGTELWQVPL